MEIDNSKRSKRERAEMAYNRLVSEGKSVSAGRLRRAIDGIGVITLGLSDIDWNIQMALEGVGLEQGELHRNGETSLFVLH